MNETCKLKQGIESILKNAKAPILTESEVAELKTKRAAEEKELYIIFYAQQPRLKDKVENIMQLEQIIKEYLDAKYELRPRMDKIVDTDFVEYRKCMAMVLKMEDSVGRNLGRLGLTLRPQQYVPVSESKSFDPKGAASVRERTQTAIDALE